MQKLKFGVPSKKFCLAHSLITRNFFQKIYKAFFF